MAADSAGADAGPTERVVIRDRRVFVPFKHRDGRIEIDLDNPDHRDPQNQIFSHTDDTGVTRVYHIPTLCALIAAHPDRFPIRPMAIEQRTLRHITRHNGVEKRYALKMPQARLNEPGIMLELPNLQHILLDGNQRYYARSLRNMKHMDFHICTEETAAPAELIDWENAAPIFV